MPKYISDRIGSLFVDSSDSKTYQIVGACTCDRTGNKMFEYRSDDSNDVERTPCAEMLQDGSWCTWIESPPRNQPVVKSKKRKAAADIVLIPFEQKWTDSSKINSENIISGKRQRRAIIS